MKGIPSWITYSVLRLLLFAVPLAILLALRIDWWIAVIAAALIGLCLSYIFLRRSRNAVATDLYAARHRDKPATTVDDDVEDAAIDSSEASGAASLPAESTAAVEPPQRSEPHDTPA